MFMSKCHDILNELSRRCGCRPWHQQLLSGRAEQASRYPPERCRAIYRGLLAQMRLEQDHVKGLLKMNKGDSLGEQPDEEHIAWGMASARDDVLGKELDPKGVRESRKTDMVYH